MTVKSCAMCEITNPMSEVNGRNVEPTDGNPKKASWRRPKTGLSKN